MLCFKLEDADFFNLKFLKIYENCECKAQAGKLVKFSQTAVVVVPG